MIATPTWCESLHFAIPNAWHETEGRPPYHVEFAPQAIRGWLVRPDNGRSSPLAVGYPLVVRQTIDVDLPFDLPVTPERQVAEGPGFRFHWASAAKDPRSLTYTYCLALTSSDSVPVAALSEYAAAVGKALATFSRSVTYRPMPPGGTNWFAIAFFVVLFPSRAGWLLSFRAWTLAGTPTKRRLPRRSSQRGLAVGSSSSGSNSVSRASSSCRRA